MKDSLSLKEILKDPSPQFPQHIPLSSFNSVVQGKMSVPPAGCPYAPGLEGTVLRLSSWRVVAGCSCRWYSLEPGASGVKLPAALVILTKAYQMRHVRVYTKAKPFSPVPQPAGL